MNDRRPPDLDARLRFLQSPAAHRLHAGQARSVQTIETHMSWVFLVGDRVLKMKKAVRYPFLDFSTLAARELDCREELRLNARLAPGVYLGLLVLCWHRGELSVAPFLRYEQFNTQARMPGGFAFDAGNADRVATVGLSFKPHPQVVFKADYQRFLANPLNDRFNLGMGYMF